MMVNSLDSRMSNLDYTLGIISNVISQFFSGIQTQSFEFKRNANESAFFISFNKVYPYSICYDWVNVGRYIMLFAIGLLNFQAPSASIDGGLATV